MYGTELKQHEFYKHILPLLLVIAELGFYET